MNWWQIIAVIVGIVAALFGVYIQGQNVSFQDYQNEIRRKNELISQLKDQVSKASSDIDAAQKTPQQQEARSKIADLEKRLREMDAEAASQKSQYEAKISRLEKQLRATVATADAQAKQYEGELSDYKEKIRILKKESTNQATEINRLKEEVKEIKGKTAPGPTYPSSPSRQLPTFPSKSSMPGPVYESGIAFEAVSCKRIGTKISVGLRITNNNANEERLFICGTGRPSDFSYADPSFLYDMQGNKHAASYVRFANQSGTDRVGQTMPSRLAMSAEITFENVPQIGDRVTVRVGGSTSEFGGKIYPVLRDIPVSE